MIPKKIITIYFCVSILILITIYIRNLALTHSKVRRKHQLSNHCYMVPFINKKRHSKNKKRTTGVVSFYPNIFTVQKKAIRFYSVRFVRSTLSKDPPDRHSRETLSHSYNRSNCKTSCKNGNSDNAPALYQLS